ncbi:MAG TPA: UvrD-helicase domain-containing protein [Candidatus Acidoferrales bacterium]|nr:UvrD-helicase domain-containing protein [Candidatus Acidoferrales bacterium]
MTDNVHHPPPPPDQPTRDAIIHERACNVAVVAGAGTGKTKTIIDRAVQLLAPAAAGTPSIPIQRMALITFTRRAAGELRFRIREHLLRELEREARGDGARAQLLRDALANLDAAFIGTIHGFADRLLRLRPVEATLSPAYALIDDNAELVRETFLRLRRAAEAGTLRAEIGPFGGALDAAVIDEAAETLRAATRAGLQMERAESAFGPLASVEATLARMIDTRDVAVELSPIPDPQLEAARAAAQRFAEMVRLLRGGERGHHALRRMAYALRRLQDAEDPADAFRIVQDALRGRALRKGVDFNSDAAGWDVYNAIRPDNTKTNSLADKLKGPHRWLATRLVRLFAVVNAMYERVKAEHEVVDYLDLLIKLRTLLRDDRDARRFYQGLFDHVFVDEFQDTDPLQCEIVFYLCEDGSAGSATNWDAVRLQPGKLTIVGDPKQSIYRFRRADIGMYDQATQRLTANGALEERLETNFRSRPELVAFFNQQLGAVLGRSDGPAFDPQTGRANYEDLAPSTTIPPAGIPVHVLPYADAADEGLLAPEGRAIEAAMLARYVRWLLAAARMIRDPDTKEERPVQAGDIAVLACVTTNLRLLLREFDALGIEYTARGGALFLGHPVIRQYLLGLRALADRDDGVAEAALLRPPFFAVDWGDAVVERTVKDNEQDPRRLRIQEARALVIELRARRHAQPPGATARDLIECTALGRAVVTGHNGRQTLAALYEVAAELDRRAAIDGLDYDAATELFRAWARDPVFLDAPEPHGAGAVRVMTIHSAKGLEFPVVILWDGFQTFSDPGLGSWWQVARDGRAWALSLGAAAVEHPAGAHLLDREKQFAEQERRRMYYVAATRARDLLVLPAPFTKSKTLRYATTELATGADATLVERFETFRIEQLPLWGRLDATAHPAQPIVGDARLQAQLDVVRQDFEDRLQAATQPVAAPTAVTIEAAGAGADEELEIGSERLRKAEAGRFGALFGSTVHRALELVLSGSIGSVDSAVSVAAQASEFTEHLADAVEDVRRGLAALGQLGVVGNPAVAVALEYPLATAWHGGKLLTGFIDLLAVGADTAMVIDFKTDAAAPGGLPAAHARYARQLRLYGEMLRTAGLVGDRQLRLGLLLTATGKLHWL